MYFCHSDLRKIRKFRAEFIGGSGTQSAGCQNRLQKLDPAFSGDCGNELPAFPETAETRSTFPEVPEMRRQKRAENQHSSSLPQK